MGLSTCTSPPEGSFSKLGTTEKSFILAKSLFGLRTSVPGRAICWTLRRKTSLRATSSLLCSRMVEECVEFRHSQLKMDSSTTEYPFLRRSVDLEVRSSVRLLESPTLNLCMRLDLLEAHGPGRAASNWLNRVLKSTKRKSLERILRKNKKLSEYRLLK